MKAEQFDLSRMFKPPEVGDRVIYHGRKTGIAVEHNDPKSRPRNTVYALFDGEVMSINVNPSNLEKVDKKEVA